MRGFRFYVRVLALLLLGLSACASTQPARTWAPRQAHLRELLEQELWNDDTPRIEAVAQWVRESPGSEEEIVDFILGCRPVTCDEHEALLAALALKVLGVTSPERGHSLSRQVLEDAAASRHVHVRRMAAYQLVSVEQYEALDVLLTALERTPEQWTAFLSPIIMAVSAGGGSDARVERAIAVMEANRERAGDEERRRLMDHEIRRLQEVLP